MNELIIKGKRYFFERKKKEFRIGITRYRYPWQVMRGENRSCDVYPPGR